MSHLSFLCALLKLSHSMFLFVLGMSRDFDGIEHVHWHNIEVWRNEGDTAFLLDPVGNVVHQLTRGPGNVFCLFKVYALSQVASFFTFVV